MQKNAGLKMAKQECYSGSWIGENPGRTQILGSTSVSAVQNSHLKSKPQVRLRRTETLKMTILKGWVCSLSHGIQCKINN